MSEIENPTVVKYENVQKESTEPGTYDDQQGAGLYELVKGQSESICVIETKGQGQHDNREVMTQDGVTHDNNQLDENGPSDRNDLKTVNAYEGLQHTRDDHPYADIEANKRV